MKDPVINLITPPEKLYNDNISFLLINPSDTVKDQFNEMAKEVGMNLNVFMFDQNETPDVHWLLDVVGSVTHIIVDIDSTNPEYQWIVGHVLGFDKTYYLTNNQVMPYNVVSTRRIYDVRQIAEENNYFVKIQGET